MKCTDGIFKGKFLYLNTTPDGELFGGGDPDELELTMYIESANLSDKHAEIKFVNNNYLFDSNFIKCTLFDSDRLDQLFHNQINLFSYICSSYIYKQLHGKLYIPYPFISSSRRQIYILNISV